MNMDYSKAFRNFDEIWYRVQRPKEPEKTPEPPKLPQSQRKPSPPKKNCPCKKQPPKPPCCRNMRRR